MSHLKNRGVFLPTSEYSKHHTRPTSFEGDRMRFATGTILFLGFVAASPADEPRSQPRSEVTMTDEARQIHREALLIDGHNDLPYQYREKKDLSFASIDIARPQKGLHTDIPRLRQGGVGAQFWAPYVST